MGGCLLGQKIWVIFELMLEWIKIRACFRYVTQKPWNRIPVVTKTLMLNPVGFYG